MGYAITNSKQERTINNIEFSVAIELPLFETLGIEVVFQGTASCWVYYGTGEVDDPNDFQVKIDSAEMCTDYVDPNKVPGATNRFYMVPDLEAELSKCPETWEKIVEQVTEAAFAYEYEDND